MNSIFAQELLDVRSDRSVLLTDNLLFKLIGISMDRLQSITNGAKVTKGELADLCDVFNYDFEATAAKSGSIMLTRRERAMLAWDGFFPMPTGTYSAKIA